MSADTLSRAKPASIAKSDAVLNVASETDPGKTMVQALDAAAAASERAELAAIQRDREREAAERNGELSEVERAFAGRSLYGVLWFSDYGQARLIERVIEHHSRAPAPSA